MTHNTIKIKRAIGTIQLGKMRLLFCLVALLAFSLGTARAQFENGSIIGTIRDSSGAVVPKAQVQVTNTETGIVKTSTTDDTGTYEIPSVHIGLYRITATRPGFDTAVADGITVSVGTRQRVDLTLAVGRQQETVEVEGTQLALETDTSQRGQIITNYQTQAFPLPTLNYSDLVGLATGVTVSNLGLNPGSASLVREGSFNVNGQRSMYNNYLLDGLDNNANGTSNQGFSNQIIQPAPTSVAQFQVVTNNESAEYGRSAGATINVAFASGTNHMHFQAYEFLRNTVLNAYGYKFPGDPGVKPEFIRNQYGMNIGGPLIRNKAFFFLDYEGFRQARTSLNFSTVPSNTDRDYAFTVALQDPIKGTAYPLDPVTKSVLLPESALSPAAVAIIKAFPHSNVPGAPDTPFTNNYAFTQRFTDNSEKYDAKIDYQWTAKTSSFLRLSQQKEIAVDGVLIPLPIDGGSNGAQQIMNQQATLGTTHQIGVNQLLEARLGISYTKGAKSTLSTGTPDIANLPGLPSDPRIFGGLPTIMLTGYTTFGRQATNPQWQYPFLLDPKVSYSILKGRHTIKFGVEYEHVRIITEDVNPLYGRYTFSGKYSGAYMADFLFGAPSKYELTSFFVAHLRQNMYFGYIQDDWRIGNWLTLNLGLRYEYGSRFSDKDNHMSDFDPATSPTTGKLLQAKSGSPYDRTLINPDLNDFAPRLGFAATLSSKMVMHGGYGISFVHTNRAGEKDTLFINPPQVIYGNVTEIPAHPKTGTGTPSATYVTFDQGFPAGFTDGANYNPLTTTTSYVPKDYCDGYVQSYFLSIQRQLSDSQILDFAYVGNHSLKLLNLANFNQRNPALGRGSNGLYVRPYNNFADIVYAYAGGYGNYNSLQIRYEQRHKRGLTLLNSFTYSRALDNSAGNLENSFGNYPGPQNLYNLRADYGPSEYDHPLVDTFSAVYELPFGKNKLLGFKSAGLNNVIGGWQLSVINSMRSGQVVSPTYSPSTNNTVSGLTSTNSGGNDYRPNRIPGVPVIKHSTIGGFPVLINAAAFSAPPATGSPFGDASRNLIRSDAFYEADVAFNKTFDLNVEDAKLQFRAQAYNILNKTNFATPGTTCCGASFGQISSTYQPRILQFAVKLLY